MRNKKTFYFNEETVAKEIIMNGFPDGKIDYSKMYMVAKYIREKLKCGDLRLEKELIEFCKKQDKHFNPIIESDAIRKWVLSSSQYGLRKIPHLSISAKEIAILKLVPSVKDRKLLFMTLMFSKAVKVGNTRIDKSSVRTSNKYYIKYSNFQDIIRLAELKNFSEKDFANLVFRYGDMFTIYNPEKQLLRLEYVDEEGSEDFTIFEVDKLQDYYEIFFGKNIETCAVCGKTFSRTGNRQKYCKDCSRKVKYQQVNELKRAKRAKDKEV